MFSLQPPTNTFEEPEIITPASAESPILATGIPPIDTLLDPALITAEWGMHDPPAFIV